MAEITLDDIEALSADLANIAQEVEEEDLPDWRRKSKPKATAVQPKPGWSASGKSAAPTNIRQALKEGKVPASALPKAEPEDEEEDDKRHSKDVLDRLTNPKGYGGAHKNRFDDSGKGKGLSGRDTGNENVVKDLRDITRTDTSKPKPVAKPYQAKEREREHEEPVNSNKYYDDTEYDGDVTGEKEELDVSEMNEDDVEAMKRQLQAEVEDDSFGIPDWKAGKYRNKNTPKAPAVVAPKAAAKPTSTRQALAAGKYVLSQREQEEADHDKAAAEGEKPQKCSVGSCDKTANKGSYCSHHHNMYVHKAPAEKREEELPAEDTCHGCQKALSGKMVRAMDQLWHPACFVCTKCHKAFASSFIPIRHKPYCKPCATSIAESEGGARAASGGAGGAHGHGGGGGGAKGGAKELDPKAKCAGCRKALGANAIEALDTMWHDSCFVCTHCKKQFPGGRFKVANNKPFCSTECFEKEVGL